ncbi:type II toxin-antitoxin system RelE/ParE family toxin [Methylobacterium sp. MA0201]|uniref:type II toxin-antitoxin system RelE/ParE family toxin n=1 Tax=Methylobacterium alsaeris TaxID=3344826 RepID=UPI00375817A9
MAHMQSSIPNSRRGFQGCAMQRRSLRSRKESIGWRSGTRGDVTPVGDGVSEMRIHVGPGDRVHCVRRGGEIVILPCGGDNSRQPRDIRRAKAVAASP